MSISGVSSQSSQSNQTSTATLEANKKKIAAEIKELQEEDATKNAKEIQTLQQQLLDIETQITQSKSQSANSNVYAKLDVGPAYSVELGAQNTQTSTKIVSQSSSEISEESQTIDLSI